MNTKKTPAKKPATTTDKAKDLKPKKDAKGGDGTWWGKMPNHSHTLVSSLGR